jgi:hypothetical protein
MEHYYISKLEMILGGQLREKYPLDDTIYTCLRIKSKSAIPRNIFGRKYVAL